MLTATARGTAYIGPYRTVASPLEGRNSRLQSGSNSRYGVAIACDSAKRCSGLSVARKSHNATLRAVLVSNLKHSHSHRHSHTHDASGQRYPKKTTMTLENRCRCRSHSLPGGDDQSVTVIGSDTHRAGACNHHIHQTPAHAHSEPHTCIQ